AGPMLATERRTIGPDETSEEVERDLSILGANLLVAALDHLSAGRSRETPQNDADATYAPRLTKEDGRMDWTGSAEHLHNVVRGLHPWPHAYSFLHERRVILRRASPRATAGRSEPPGTILESHGDTLVVATGGGSLGLLELQLEGKRPLHARA